MSSFGFSSHPNCPRAPRPMRTLPFLPQVLEVRGQLLSPGSPLSEPHLSGLLLSPASAKLTVQTKLALPSSLSPTNNNQAFGSNLFFPRKSWMALILDYRRTNVEVKNVNHVSSVNGCISREQKTHILSLISYPDSLPLEQLPLHSCLTAIKHTFWKVTFD